MTPDEANQLHLVMTDGTTVGIPQPRPMDMVKWERYARSRGLATTMTDASVEQVLYLAYLAVHRGVTPMPEFDAWADQVAEVQGGDAEDPTSTPMEASGG